MSSGWEMDDDYRRYATKGGAGHYQSWHCTADGVTKPCGDCDGCRYDQGRQEATSAGNDLEALVDSAEAGQRFMVIREGRRKAVLIGFAEYERLVAAAHNDQAQPDEAGPDTGSCDDS